MNELTPLWSDTAIEDAIYDITYGYRVSQRTRHMVAAKLYSMRDGYEQNRKRDKSWIARLEADLSAARGLLSRAEIEIDLRTGDDDDMAELHEDIADFLRPSRNKVQP